MTRPPPLPAFSGCGIELEYMIVDRATLAVRPIADTLLCDPESGPGSEVARGGMGWSNELALHVLEVKNLRPEADLPALAAAFQGEVDELNRRLAALGARLMPTAMHPWMDPQREGRLWDRDNAALYRSYEHIFGCRGHGWMNLQSMHLNLPFADDREFARLHAAIRLLLPILPALAASSPFADGRHTGFLDHRLEAYCGHQARLPATIGEVIPDNAGSRDEYEERILAPMYRELASVDPEGLLRHEWLNARGAIARFDRNAIEIRVLDAQECPRADLAIAAATVFVLRRLYVGDAAVECLQGPATGVLVRLFRRCIRDADEARIDDEDYLALLGWHRGPCSANALWRFLLDGGEAAELAPWRGPLQLILEQGPLARRLLRAVGMRAERPRLEVVYRALCDGLAAGRLFVAAG